ncbi:MULTISPECIES: sensor histidine kinase [Hungatella]|jgi:two-component system sensor histidine kinase YesM
MMKKLLQNRTVKFKIMVYNICIICVIGIIFSVTSYVTANKKAVQLAQNSVEYHVESISRYYQEVYEQMVNLVLNCAEREMFDLSSLGQLDTVEEKRRGLDYAKLAANFCTVTGYGDYITRLSIFDDNDVHISAGTALSSVDDGRRIQNAPWFDRELKKDMYDYRLDLVNSPFYKEVGMTIPIICKNSGYKDSDCSALFLSPRLYLDRLKEDDNGNTMLVTTYRGERIATLRESENQKEESDRLIDSILRREEGRGTWRYQINGEPHLVSYNKESQSGALVIEIMDMANLKNDSLMLMQTVGLIFISCVLLGISMSFLFTNAVRKPIDRLVNHVGRIAKGDFSQEESLESQDEIGLIGKAVNSMSSQIEQLMDKRLEDEKEKSSLEIRMLQAQINPHFLYNTLDSIKWIAVIQKNSGIVKAVTALSKLLKNMAKGVDERVTLREELDFVRDYVTIEKLKYVEMFDLEVDIGEEMLYDARIVKLTLQPLVENAIFSGIEPGGKNGTIRIRAYEKDKCLCVDVRDDGIGIPEEKIPELLNHSEKLKGDQMSSIGMPNVDRRLKLIYGEEYGLSVESQVGEYTQITVRIPLEY